MIFLFEEKPALDDATNGENTTVDADFEALMAIDFN
jgi:hypothetical protein